jgi:hypothetical protein
MIKIACLLSLWLLSANVLTAQLRVVMAGNTADGEPAFFQALDQRLKAVGGPEVVLFAGDYVAECTDEMVRFKLGNGNGREVFATLQPVVELVRSNPGVTFYFVPGDRDWDHSGKQGLRCVKRLEDYLNSLDLPNLNWPLRNGCPGPELVNLSDEVALLMVNTQWWNHPYDKPVPADADCKTADSDIAIDETMSLIEKNTDRNVILAGHYPPYSQGRHGGEFPTGQHFVPPIIGGILLSWRQNIGTPKDLNNKRLASLRRTFKNNSGQTRGIFFLGAQDQSQQLIRYRENYIVNAGAAGPGRWVGRHKPALHTSREAGFTEMVFGKDGAVSYEYRLAGSGNLAFQRDIYSAPCVPGTLSDKNGIPPNPAYRPCNVSDDEMAALCSINTSKIAVVTPGAEYAAGKVRELLLGKHHRDAWTTPVTVPVQVTSEYKGGLVPLREGHTKLSQSLRFRAPSGKEYLFKSIDKNARKALDFELRGTFIGNIVDDQTSIGHPFGRVVVPPLMENLDILHVSPELLILGNCPALGDYNPAFGGLLGTLEEAPKGDKKKKGIPGTFGAKKMHKSYEAFRIRFDDQEVEFAYDEYLRARLFDLLIGDWNRHEDNWQWAEFDRDGIRYLRPVPRDRDKAFSLIDGIGPRFVTKVFLTRLEHFGYKKPDAGSLSYQSRHLDRLLLSQMSMQDYLREAQAIQFALSDEIIEAAIKTMPAETYAVSGAEIVAKLKARRDELASFAEDFYLMYAETVDIVGTNDEEEFRVRTFGDNLVEVTVTDIKGRSKDKVLYQRTFHPHETREIRLYGLGDDDVFQLDGKAGGPINVRLIGGPGKDAFRSEIDEKGSKALVYEKSKTADEAAPEGMKFVKSYRDYLYSYDRTAHEFNKISPAFGASISGFNGLSLGLGLRFRRYNFTRRKYSTEYKFYFEGNARGNYFVELSADFKDIYKKVDFVINTHYGVPDFRNFFFGIGSNTSFDRDAVVRNEFHLVRLQNLSGEMGFRRRFGDKSYVSLMAGIQSNRPEKTGGTILDTETPYFGTEKLVYGYLQPKFVLDLRDDKRLPSKGIMLEASQKWAYSPDGEGQFGVTKLGAEAHFSPRRSPMSLSFKVGYANSTGRVPFYELPVIGRNNGLRGFQRGRFTGDGYVFYNTEFRTPVAKIRGKFIPLTLGVRVFYDRGKLLQRDEEDAGMKDAFGFGFYMVPISKRYTMSVLTGFSVEEHPVFRFSVGTRF